MTYEIALALAGFAFVSSITPGPNNLMLMASGANFGLRRTLPHMAGVALGFGLMVFMVGVGVSGILTAFPVLASALKLVMAIYLLWLAWKIANAAPANDQATARAHPFTFLQAAAFQWVNPKAWTMALTAVALYAPDRNAMAVASVAVVFTIVNLPSVGFWAVAGTQVQRVFRSAVAVRRFNITMALMLIASLVPAFMH